MRRLTRPDQNTRELLFNKAKNFQARHPADARLAALFAEVATLYDGEPARKKELLETARLTAVDPALQQRIDDDLKRIALLGQPVALKFTSTRGAMIDLEKLRGKVVLVYFFATWSPPSLAALDLVRDFPAAFSPADVQPLGISLDEDPATLAATVKTHKIDWPIACDRKGWQSPLIRSLGINALPTLWIIDRAGRLRALNAKDEAPALITQLLRER